MRVEMVGVATIKLVTFVFVLIALPGSITIAVARQRRFPNGHSKTQHEDVPREPDQCRPAPSVRS
jgi:hypothetical protein